METGWIRDNIASLKKLYESSTEEQALSSYIISVIRLLNGMVQIMDGGFHRYERIVLGNAIRLFCEHFRQQVQCAIDCVDDVGEKNEIILDIENAVLQIAQVYKNIVDSTANADKRMFMSLAVDTSLYEFSPKLCGLYACMLEWLVRLYDASGTGQQEYAFLIHPTLESNIKAKVLFKKRENSGKVVVVYIPVNILDRTDLVPVIALHEAFHVLTKKERERKHRAKLMLKLALSGIEDCLFRNIILCMNDRSLDQRRKSEFMEIWFGEIKNDFMQECNALDGTDRFWYSENLLPDITKKLLKGLQQAIEYLEQKKFIDLYMCEGGGFKKCVEEYHIMCEQSLRLLQNLHGMIIGDTLYQMLDRYMHILREAYADVACIITAHLEPESYDLAFDRSIQFKIQKRNFKDVDREMRRMLVYDTVICYADEDFNKRWKLNKMKKHEDNTDFGGLWFFNNEKVLNNAGQKWGKCDNIPIIYQECFFYLKACAQNLKEIDKNPHIKQFREKIKSIIANQDEELLTILGGSYGK